ncbi:MAG: response regulator [Desulfonatronovibrionaceae bacterium]
MADENYPPYEFRDSRGRVRGFNVDVFRAVAEIMGLDVRIKAGQWSEIRSALEKGEIDGLTGMYYSEERDKRVDFSSSFITVRHAVFIKESTPGISRLNDVHGRSVAIQRGDIMHDYVREKDLTQDIVVARNQVHALRLLQAGKCDCALLAKLQGLYNLKRLKIENIKAVGTPFYPREYCFAVGEGREKLADTLNEGLAILKTTERYDLIYKKWFGQIAPKGIPVAQILRYAALIITPLIAIVLMIFIWTITLRKKVKEKTADLTAELVRRQEAEKAYQLMADRLAFHIENSPLAVIEWEGGKYIKHWSSQAEIMFGWTREEVVGKNWQDFDFIHPEDREKTHERIEKLFNGTEVFNTSKNRNFRKDGSIVHCQWYNSALRDESGNMLSLLSQVADVSELNEALQDLKEAKEQAEAANRAKSEFLANMSHEIRTPLNGILGMLQLLQTTELDREQNEYLEMASNSSRRLTRLLSDILDLSRIESDKLELKEEEIILEDIKQSVEDIFRHTCRENNNTLQITLDDKLPEKVLGDGTRLTQILFNLVGNALKYTRNGEVSLEISCLPGSGLQLGRMLLMVKDNGPGIPEDKTEQVFEPFTQVSESKSLYARQYEGAGLGLPLVKRLVRLMGGNMAIDSEPGKGTAMYVSLPFKLPQSRKQKNGTCEPQETFSNRIRGRQVLLVDDDPVTRLYLKHLLEKEGGHISVARDGGEALEMLAEKEFDCVLMDVQMPVMDGVEATKRIRSSGPGCKDIPIIALTAYAMSGDREKFLAAGMDAYLAKPVDREELMRLLKEHLS